MDERLRKEFEERKNRVFARTAAGATPAAKQNLDDSYRLSIDYALEHAGIRGLARTRLIDKRERGPNNTPAKPEALKWLQDKVWVCLAQSVDVATMRALAVTDRYPLAISQLYKAIKKLMEPFLGRKLSSELTEIVPNASKLRKQGVTWGRIAKQLRPEDYKKHPKRCTDRIRLAVRYYEEQLREK